MANTKTRAIHPDTEASPTQQRNVQELADATDQLVLLQNEANANARQLAIELSYDGTLTVGALEDEIRFYQRRTVEACLELGKRLLILKELTPYGEFEKRVELLGISKRMAQKFMSAILKFSKANSNSLLKVIDSQSKMLELVMLDDEEIELLESGQSVRGLNLDKIETMSVSELKKALRESKETLQAKDEVIRNKTEALDNQAEQIAVLQNRQRTITPEAEFIQAREQVQRVAADIKASIMTQLRGVIRQLHQIDGDHKVFAGAALIEISQELRILRDEYLLPETINDNPMPEWLDAAALAEIEAMG